MNPTIYAQTKIIGDISVILGENPLPEDTRAPLRLLGRYVVILKVGSTEPHVLSFNTLAEAKGSYWSTITEKMRLIA